MGRRRDQAELIVDRPVGYLERRDQEGRRVSAPPPRTYPKHFAGRPITPAGKAYFDRRRERADARRIEKLAERVRKRLLAFIDLLRRMEFAASYEGGETCCPACRAPGPDCSFGGPASHAPGCELAALRRDAAISLLLEALNDGLEDGARVCPNPCGQCWPCRVDKFLRDAGVRR